MSVDIKIMGEADLAMVLDWAAAEGWNPGLDDAAAFWASDTEGFYLLEVDGTPAAAISVVNHDADHAFLGLYICRPAFRGQGHGIALWQAAMQHAQGRSVGLDGVPDQQANYRKSGFDWVGRTIRFQGQIAQPDAMSVSQTITPIAPEHLSEVITLDRQAVGHARDRFAQAWFTGTTTRQTLIADEPSQGFATYRQCREGVKIGPLHAVDAATARSLIEACPFSTDSAPVFIDVPEGTALQALVEDMGFGPVFETARMVRGRPHIGQPPAFYSVATLELG